MWVKICGNTNLEDALLAAELGADAVGFVFAPSVRQVTAAQVAQIVAHLPDSLERVGVFPAWSAEKIRDIAREAGLTAVQLHGGVDQQMPSVRQAFEGLLQAIPVLHWEAETEEASVMDQMNSAAAAGNNRVLIDSKVGSALGGTGVSFDWHAARNVFASPPTGMKLILAGGLKPETVADAIRKLQPWGVDVSSGVEAHAGRKDPEKLAQFIQRAKALHG
ncbi:phosphoribosylanthranilate isomerase [Granulicella arctica]|uniref:phosphoribosylanthranilate isomerase n=1 Tax=Granulicella arctica TaxID=940613 RepID=UPI0021DF70E0|nr:phosphoribosylanthranilate isomerase [Granulicella arctica]